jgi:hypothetical protein
MIYRCWNCGLRINERYKKPSIAPQNIGKHLLYDHVPFCTEECIDEYRSRKQACGGKGVGGKDLFGNEMNPNKMQRAPISDICELGGKWELLWCTNTEHTDAGWKVDRKRRRRNSL